MEAEFLPKLLEGTFDLAKFLAGSPPCLIYGDGEGDIVEGLVVEDLIILSGADDLRTPSLDGMLYCFPGALGEVYRRSLPTVPLP